MISAFISAIALSASPLPVLVFRRTGETGSEIMGMTQQGEFVILRGAQSDSLKAAISPDGTKIAFIASKKLFVAPLRRETYETASRVSARRWVTEARRVRAGEWTGAVLIADSASSGPSWLPDGSALVYARPHADSGFREQGDIMRVEVRRDGTGGASLQLTNTTGGRHRDSVPICSPDGTRVLYSRDTDPRGLYTVSPRGGTPSPLGLGLGWDSTCWMPDGRRILASRISGDGSGLFAFGFPKTGTPQMIHYSRAQDASPQVSPDGRSLAFARPTRITSALTVPKLLIGSLGDEGERFRRMPTMITPAATSTADYPLQWIALPL